MCILQDVVLAADRPGKKQFAVEEGEFVCLYICYPICHVLSIAPMAPQLPSFSFRALLVLCHLGTPNSAFQLPSHVGLLPFLRPDILLAAPKPCGAFAPLAPQQLGQHPPFRSQAMGIPCPFGTPTSTF